MYDEKYFAKRFKLLERKRNPLNSEMKDVRDNIFPDAGLFPGDTQTESEDYQYNEYFRQNVINAKATDCHETLSNALLANMMSPNLKWFGVRSNTDDASFEDDRWLQACEKIIYNLFDRSGLYRAAHMYFSEMTAFGCACMSYEFNLKDGFVFKSFTAGEFYFETDDMGRPTSVYREFNITLKEMVDIYGTDALTVKELDKYNNSKDDSWMYDEMVCLIHAVEKNANHKKDNPFKKVNISATYRKGGKVIKIGGIDYFPYLIARWSKTGKNIYGNGLGRKALGDAKSLQAYEKTYARAAHKTASPLLIAHPGLENDIKAAVAKDKESLQADGIIYTGVKEPIKSAYDVRFEFVPINNKIEKLEDNLKHTFLNDMFFAITEQSKNMSATEVSARRQEQMTQVGGSADRIKNEFLAPLVEGCMQLALDNNVFPPAPENIDADTISFTFKSLLLQAQDLTDVSLIERFTQFVLQLSASFPEVAVKLNPDKIIDQYAMRTGVDLTVVKDDEEYQKEMTEMKQKANEQQQQTVSADNFKTQAEGARALSQAMEK